MKYRNLIGAIVVALAIFIFYLSYVHFIGIEDLPEAGISCHALCGLIIISETLFGPTLTCYTASGLYLFSGVFLLSGWFLSSRQNRD